MLDKVINGYARPGLSFFQGISRAFNVPLEIVLRRAGLLPLASAVSGPNKRSFDKVVTTADATLDDRRLLEDLQRRIERLDAEDRRYLSDLVNRLFPGA